MLARLGVDRAVVFSVLTNFWRAAAGLISLVLIARFFSPEIQGFYYTFVSLLALQSFVELGLSLVILNTASHEWSKLSLDSSGKITGDALALSRLASLARFTLIWFSVAALIFILGVGLIGYLFFSQSAGTAIEWRSPWFWVVLLTGLAVFALPFIALLEGCNQVGTVNQFRFGQAMLVTLAQWLAIILHGELWVLVVSAAINLGSAFWLLAIRYRGFFDSLLRQGRADAMDWKTEIWPMQWRLGVSGLVNYFAFSLFNPVMFHYHGAVAAGQMGMTLSLAVAIQSIGLAWVNAKAPTFGNLVARKDYRTLDRFWLKMSFVSMAVVTAGLAVAWVFLWGLNAFDIALAKRMLPSLPAGLFFIATVLLQITQCEAAYLRAHKKEPLVAVGVVSGLAIGFLVWQMGGRFGPTGAGVAYLGVVGFCIVPWITYIWFCSRAEWHRT
jgi:O-antigen/teichoic acid export membrane protein